MTGTGTRPDQTRPEDAGELQTCYVSRRGQPHRVHLPASIACEHAARMPVISQTIHLCFRVSTFCHLTARPWPGSCSPLTPHCWRCVRGAWSLLAADTVTEINALTVQYGNLELRLLFTSNSDNLRLARRAGFSCR